MNNQMGINNFMNIHIPNNNNKIITNQPNQILLAKNQNIISNKIEKNIEPIKLPKKKK
jgi:hypothetical protein